jgi:hypothetical protein
MGDEVGPDDPTQLAGMAETEPASLQAWGLANEAVDYPVKQPRVFTLGQIVTVAAVVASLAVVVGVAMLIGYHLRSDARAEPVPVSPSTSAPSMVQATLPPPPPPSRLPTPVLLPPIATATVTVRAPAPPAPRSAAVATFTTYISWVGAPCIDYRYPNLDSVVAQTTCDPSQTYAVIHTARSGQLIGVDPVMGQAVAIACKVVSNATQAVVYGDSGTAGDGHDINCIVTAP